MSNDQKQQEAPPAVQFTNSMTQAVLTMAGKYLPEYRFVLVGYTPPPENETMIEAAIGTNLNPHQVKETLEIVLEIVKATVNQGHRNVSFIMPDPRK